MAATENSPLDENKDAKILLADDDPRLLDSLRGLLGLYGYQVDTAVGGREAITKLCDQPYDLLLLDLRMPSVSGHDVMQYMADHSITTMTIVISGETSLDDISTALRNGAYDYLKKPYVPEELLATVSNALRKKRLEDSHRVMQARLNRSERLHRYIVDNSPDIIYVLNEEGAFSFINSKIEDLLGYSRNELLGRPITSVVEEDDLEKAHYFFEQACKPLAGSRSIDLALRSKQLGRSKRFFEISVWPVNDAADLPNESKKSFRIYGTARDITERMEAEAFINFQAYHDLLTRLPNRSLFKDRLSVAITQAQRNDQKLAVMFIDLDRFKIINDSLGHTMGDRLLQTVSQRLQSCVRKGDTLSRFGGDEFTLLLPDVQSEESAYQVAEKILESVTEPFELGGHNIYIGASIGIAIYPDGGTTMDSLIKNADIAMYRVKNTGKNGIQVYQHDLNSSPTQRLLLEQDMRRALENNEFEICYQPQVNAHTEEVCGVEALIRWNHPSMGRLSPAEFISIAEDSRLIIDIDRHTLAKACREILSHSNGDKPLRLSVNLSPLIVEKDFFVDTVLGTLKAEGFPPELLELEITENILLSDRQDTIDKLQQLSDAGVNFAIDDFGTGYSSLSYLQKFPINTLKIDRSFINVITHADGEDACIVNAIVSMAQGLKMNIVAEGVENLAQLQYLRKLGCDVVQGFLFGEATDLKQLRGQMQRLEAERRVS